MTFERGMALANRCAEILEAAELRVTRVLESGPASVDEPAF
jgi:exodeoxyribonuclease VII small subunit